MTSCAASLRTPLALQVGDVVSGDGDEFPAVFAQLIEQIDIITAARDVVEVDFFVFEFRHGNVRDRFAPASVWRKNEPKNGRPIEMDIHSIARGIRTTQDSRSLSSAAARSCILKIR